jgi:hypothetical protein
MAEEEEKVVAEVRLRTVGTGLVLYRASALMQQTFGGLQWSSRHLCT